MIDPRDESSSHGKHTEKNPFSANPSIIGDFVIFNAFVAMTTKLK